jgi:hypothetical protein
LKDFDVAWKEGEYRLHSEDVRSEDSELVDELIKRSIAKRVNMESGP